MFHVQAGGLEATPRCSHCGELASYRGQRPTSSLSITVSNSRSERVVARIGVSDLALSCMFVCVTQLTLLGRPRSAFSRVFSPLTSRPVRKTVAVFIPRFETCRSRSQTSSIPGSGSTKRCLSFVRLRYDLSTGFALKQIFGNTI